MTEEIGFGGSCHWCTEAIFLSLKGTVEVKQGWIASADAPDRFSEAVIVKFDPQVITLDVLNAVHLHTHSCTSAHSMRSKYRSAVYCFSSEQREKATQSIKALQSEFTEPIITEVVCFHKFKLNRAEYLNYYYSDSSKPFCRNIVNPKLKKLLIDFSDQVDQLKLKHLEQVEG